MNAQKLLSLLLVFMATSQISQAQLDLNRINWGPEHGSPSDGLIQRDLLADDHFAYLVRKGSPNGTSAGEVALEKFDLATGKHVEGKAYKRTWDGQALPIRAVFAWQNKLYLLRESKALSEQRTYIQEVNKADLSLGTLTSLFADAVAREFTRFRIVQSPNETCLLILGKQQVAYGLGKQIKAHLIVLDTSMTVRQDRSLTLPTDRKQHLFEDVLVDDAAGAHLIGSYALEGEKGKLASGEQYHHSITSYLPGATEARQTVLPSEGANLTGALYGITTDNQLLLSQGRQGKKAYRTERIETTIFDGTTHEVIQRVVSEVDPDTKGEARLRRVLMREDGGLFYILMGETVTFFYSVDPNGQVQWNSRYVVESTPNYSTLLHQGIFVHKGEILGFFTDRLNNDERRKAGKAPLRNKVSGEDMVLRALQFSEAGLVNVQDAERRLRTAVGSVRTAWTIYDEDNSRLVFYKVRATNTFKKFHRVGVLQLPEGR